MKRNSLIVVAVLLLAAGVIALAVHLRGPSEADGDATAARPRATDRGGAPAGGFQGEPAATPARRTERETDDAELVEKYGDARTKLARSVSENVVGLLDDVISMGEMMVNGGPGGEWNRGDWQLRQLTRGTEIELSDEQREQAAQLLKDFRARELQKTKDAVGELRDNPAPLMGLLLAGDARSREELSEEDYAALQQANADALGDIINPLDRNNFQGGRPIEDDTFRAGFEALLDADQAAAFREAQAAREAENPGDGGGSRTDITRMPVMELEAADEAIRSTRQMTAGFKQVMEGMGNLGPLLEQQRRGRQEQ